MATTEPTLDMANPQDATTAADLRRAARLAAHDRQAAATAKIKGAHPHRKASDATGRGRWGHIIPTDRHRGMGPRHACPGLPGGTLAKRVSKRFEGRKQKVWWCPRCDVATVKTAPLPVDMDKQAEAPGLAESMAAAAHHIGEQLAPVTAVEVP